MRKAWPGQEEASLRGPPARPVRGSRTSGHQTVARAGGIARLVPGGHGQRGAALAVPMLLTTLEACLADSAPQQAQEGVFGAQEEGMEGLRHGYNSPLWKEGVESHAAGHAATPWAVGHI